MNLEIFTQLLYHAYFNVGRHGTIPSQQIILRWVDSFQNMASALKSNLVADLADSSNTGKHWNSLRMCATES